MSSLFINVITGQYPFTIEHVRFAHPNVSIPDDIESFGDFMRVADPETLPSLFPWEESYETFPQKDGNVMRRCISKRPKPLSSAKNERLAWAKMLYDDKLRSGLATSLGFFVRCEDDDTGKFRDHYLGWSLTERVFSGKLAQLRADTTADRAEEILSLELQLSALSLQPVRDFNNDFHDVTLDQLMVLISELWIYRVTLHRQYWSLCSSIESATSSEAVFSFEWPT